LNFKYSIDNFRGLAILFVMLSHLGAMQWLGLVGDIGHFLVVDATTWFVFISGYLFHYIEFRRFKYANYLKKKAKFVFLPYLIFSTPAILAGIYFSRNVELGLSRGNYVLWSLLVGGSVVPPMWFMPMIIIFFFMSPAFRAVAQTKWIYIITFVGMTISLFSFRPVQNQNPFLEFVHFFGFYLLGMLMSINSRCVDVVKKSRAAPLVISLGVALFVLCAFMHDFNQERPLGFSDGWGHLNFVQLAKFGLLISFYFLFECYLNFKQPILAYLAEVSFGLFFMHGFFMILSSRFERRLSLENLWAIFLLEFIIGIGGSILTVFLIKCVLKSKSRYVMGC